MRVEMIVLQRSAAKECKLGLFAILACRKEFQFRLSIRSHALKFKHQPNPFVNEHQRTLSDRQ